MYKQIANHLLLLKRITAAVKYLKKKSFYYDVDDEKRSKEEGIKKAFLNIVWNCDESVT